MPAQGRLIPQRTARFHVLVSRSGGLVEVDETFNRPQEGTITREYLLRIGTVQVTVEAQAADGTVLASQSAEAEIREGETTSATLELTPRPEIQPQLTLTATPSTVKTDEAVTVQWNAQDDDRLVRVEVDTNGDGTLEPVEATAQVQVSFSDPGVFTLRGEAEDNDGLVAQAETQVVVQPRLGQLEIIVK